MTKARVIHRAPCATAVSSGRAATPLLVTVLLVTVLLVTVLLVTVLLVTGLVLAGAAQDLGRGGQPQPRGLDRHPLQGPDRAQLVAAHQHRAEPVLAAVDHVGDPQRLFQCLTDLLGVTG